MANRQHDSTRVHHSRLADINAHLVQTRRIPAHQPYLGHVPENQRSRSAGLVLFVATACALGGCNIDNQELATSVDGASAEVACDDASRSGDCRGTLALDDGIRMHYFRSHRFSKPNPAITQAIIVIHGNSNNPWSYFDYISEAVKRNDAEDQTIIVAPYFRDNEESGSAPSRHAVWSQDGWKVGDKSRTSPRVSSFAALDQIVERLTSRGRYSNLQSIVIAGHSAGGQFVQRYAAGNRADNPEDVEIRYVAANASSYMWLNSRRVIDGELREPSTSCNYNDYKYGMDDRNSYMSSLSRSEIRSQFVERDVTYLAGSLENNCECDESGEVRCRRGDCSECESGLACSCKARYQGLNRYERVVNLMQSLDTDFSGHSHQMKIVSGVGHSGRKMFNCGEGLAALLGSRARAASYCPEDTDDPPPGDTSEIEFVAVGQALVKYDPRDFWSNPYSSVRPILSDADVAFTNFEMSVNGRNNGCDVDDDYVLALGIPRLARGERPGNTSKPHAVDDDVMEFLSDIGFNLMSLANNHAWDLGDCGVRATIDAANANGIVHAGTGRNYRDALGPSYMQVNGQEVALIAATTSNDDRAIRASGSSPGVNGIWTGYQSDWDANLDAVRAAARRAEMVVFYHHFQIDDEAASGDGDDDHRDVGGDAARWQRRFARAVIEAGASVYIAHGHRGFEGLMLHQGRPIFTQLGGFAYQGRNPGEGYYDDDHAWEGLLVKMSFSDGAVRSLEFIPLELDEGNDYRDRYRDTEDDPDDISPNDDENTDIRDNGMGGFLARRGHPSVATGSKAASILRRFRNLSRDNGVRVEIEGERGRLLLSD